MAVIIAVPVTATATSVPPAAAATSMEISAPDVGPRGALLNIINGAGAPINVTLVDPGVTPAGSTAAANAQAVANATDRWFFVSPKLVDQAAGEAVVTLSSATTITYKLIRL